MIGLRDALHGCLLGGAIGDALGFAHEGSGPGEKRLALGAISDDTELTLATCDAIARAKGKVDPERIGARFGELFLEDRVRGLGSATLRALRDLSLGGHWALVGRRGEFAAGNGAATRIAPLAFALDPRSPIGRRTIRDVSRITHHSDEAYAGALAICLAIHDAAGRERRAPRLESIAAELPDTLVRERIEAIARSRDELDIGAMAVRFGNTGYVVESVPLALFAAARGAALGFDAMMREIVFAGGDTDSIASMAGQCLGALRGANGLSSEWLAALSCRSEIEATADAVAQRLALD
jgi:ADP-ribosylglycohydrolase